MERLTRLCLLLSKEEHRALIDILKEKYSLDTQPSSLVAPKDTISAAALKYLPSQTVFTALDKNMISFWVLRKGSKTHHRQFQIERGNPDLLMETTFERDWRRSWCQMRESFFG